MYTRTMQMATAKTVNEVPYIPVAEIDFKGATRKMRDLSCSTEDGDSNTPTKRRKTREPAHIENDQRQREFLSKLSLCGTRPALLAITEPYSESFIPFGSMKNLLLQNLYSPSNAACSLDIILKKCEELTLPVLSNEQLQKIQCETAKQAHSKLWFKLRSGRITTSKFKQSCRTDANIPSRSLIKSICYPTESKFINSTVA